MPPWNSALSQPGTIRIVPSGGRRVPYGPCSRCGRDRALYGRRLCQSCRYLCQLDGTLDDYGYPKGARLADWAALRRGGLLIPDATARMAEVCSPRTCLRYEAELAAAGLAPWRATDPNVQRLHRNRAGS
jgi:hypothetical protein